MYYNNNNIIYDKKLHKGHRIKPVAVLFQIEIGMIGTTNKLRGKYNYFINFKI